MKFSITKWFRFHNREDSEILKIESFFAWLCGQDPCFAWYEKAYRLPLIPFLFFFNYDTNCANLVIGFCSVETWENDEEYDY